MEIQNVIARQVFDSRGNPTVEAEIKTKNSTYSAIVASGASTGSKEALELRDNEKAFMGKGVKKAVFNVNHIIAPKLKGRNVSEQGEIDKIMIEVDATPNKSSLGANATSAVSMAAARAGAAEKNISLYQHIADLAGNRKFTMPVPQFNIINGGRHAGLENDIQEHMVMPVGAKNYSQALQMGTEIYHTLKKMLKGKFGAQGILIADEGGFVPSIKDADKRLNLLQSAIDKAGYSKEVRLALDCAASEFYSKGTYTIAGKKYSAAELVDFYAELVERFNIFSIEDGMDEEDWDGWKLLTEKLGGKIQIVGDDLLVTNPALIKDGIRKKACNSLLLKINQIGTLTESIESAKLAFESGWSVVVSHRSAETEDSFIADLVVGIGAQQCKFGAPARSDRNSKYNRLLRIEDLLQKDSFAPYFGENCR